MKYQGHKGVLACEDSSCEGCRARLFKANLPLVRFFISKYFPGANRGLYGAERDWDDLMQAGCMGLWHAILRRDPTKARHEWQGYMARCIHGYLLTSMRDSGKAFFERANDGKRPKMVQVDFTICENQDSESSDNYYFRLANKKLVDFQYELGNRPWWDLDQLVDENRERLRKAVEALPERLRHILTVRMDEGSLQDASNALGITRERIRQLQKRAIRELFFLIHSKQPTKKAELEMIAALNMFDPSHFRPLRKSYPKEKAL